MYRKILMTALTLVVSAGAWAQTILSGTVSDEKGNPLPGAAVYLKENRAVGTVADGDGRYSLRLPDDGKCTVCLNYIGYKPMNCILDPQKNPHRDFTLEPDTDILNEVVVTGTRTPKLLKDVPVVTRLILSDDIRKADVATIGDLLETELPGIEFSYSMNQQVSLNMQGFGGNSVLFLVDGERIAGETLDNIDYDRLNLDNIERIEIVKGAASTLYGSNAVGGVVNLITKKESEPWNVNLNARYGAHNEQRYGGSAGFNAGRFQNTLCGQYNSMDAIDLGDNGDYNEIYANRNYSVKDKLVYTPCDQLKLTANAGYFFRERDNKGDLLDRYRSFSGGLRGNWQINDKNNLELIYSFDQYDKSDFSKITKLDVRDYSNVQNNVRAVYNLTLGEKYILTAGADYLKDYLMSYQFTEDRNNYGQSTADVFAQFDWTPLKGFNVTAGLRYDFFSEARLSHLSPKVSLMYKVKDFTVRGSYASGFRAPTLKEMYMNFNMANIFMIYGNPNLNPESSHNFVLSGEWGTRNYNVQVMGFYNLVDNRITTAWSHAKDGMVYSNMAPLRIGGVNADISAKFDFGLGAKLSYAYTHEHIDKGQPLISSTRPHALTARVEYSRYWKNYNFSIVLNGRYLSKVHTAEYVSEESYEQTVDVTYPGYTMWKLNFSQGIYKGIHLVLSVDNLFNYVPDYYYSNSPTTTGTTFSAGLSVDIADLIK